MSLESQEKTVGSIALEKLKRPEDHNSIDLQQEIHKGYASEKSYEEEIWDCVDRGLKDPSIEGDFYVVVLVKKERLLQNIIRNYFLYRKSCPQNPRS